MSTKVVEQSTQKQPATEPDYFVHPSAYVDRPCSIGPGTKIWHFSHIMEGARIGRDCSLGQNVFVASSAILGDGVKVRNNVSILDGVVLEDAVFCGPSVVFSEHIRGLSQFSRSENGTVDTRGLSQFSRSENGTVPLPARSRSGENGTVPLPDDTHRKDQRTLIRRGATLGPNSTIACGLTVGQYAFVSAGAVVDADVPAFALLSGVPAKRIGWLCRCGETTLDFSGRLTSCCTACGRHYRLDSAGPQQYSPAGQRARDKAKHYEQERRYVESITPGRG